MMKRQLDAYKLLLCMYPSNYNRFRDIVRKSSFIHTLLHWTRRVSNNYAYWWEI